MGRVRLDIDWSHHITAQPSSGLGIRAYCLREGFSVWTFYDHRKRLAGKQTPASVPATLSPVPTKNSHVDFIQIGSLQSQSIVARCVDGTVIEFHGMTHQDLPAIINALKGASRC